MYNAYNTMITHHVIGDCLILVKNRNLLTCLLLKDRCCCCEIKISAGVDTICVKIEISNIKMSEIKSSSTGDNTTIDVICNPRIVRIFIFLKKKIKGKRKKEIKNEKI